jgi:hypothetical protein
MNWELYEVWSLDEDGHEELIDTTKSLKEATALAKTAIAEGAVSSWIFRETEEGDLEEIERYENG